MGYIDCPLLTLYAVGATGTKLCLYSKPRDRPLIPRRILLDPDLILDAASTERWDYDILEEDEVQKFQAVVEEAKQGCATL